MMIHFEHLDAPALKLYDVTGDAGDSAQVHQHDSRDCGVVPGLLWLDVHAQVGQVMDGESAWQGQGAVCGSLDPDDVGVGFVIDLTDDLLSLIHISEPTRL